jgi:hypothetical protein
MPSSILNSDDGVISGTSGLKSSGGDDGVLKIQNNGTDAITVASNGNVTLAAGLTTTSPTVVPAGTVSAPSITTTGDTNTGIFFSAADTVDVATGGTAGLQLDSSQNFKFNSGYGSVATAYGCRAWVNFDGTGTPAIREDGNVSSITDDGTGKYTVNFATAMPDANYALSGTGYNNGGNNSVGLDTTRPPSASAAPISVTNTNTGGALDGAIVTVIIAR